MSNNTNNDHPRRFKLTFDPNDVTIILKHKVSPGEEITRPRIKISNTVTQYTYMYHTTDLTALSFIFSKQTFRNSCLTNVKLNDQMEKARVGISQFAGSRFISCFAHIEKEDRLFWNEYGGEKMSNKVMLKFKNFANNFKNAIYTDYCLIENNRKVLFNTEENIKAAVNQAEELKASNYVLNNFVDSIELFDVEYLKEPHEAFVQDYSSASDIDFSNITSSNNPKILRNVPSFHTDCLGRQKTDTWKKENETRILSCLENQDFNEWSFIDLRLKDDFFRDLKIIKSPCETKDYEEQIRHFIDSSNLSTEIKESIVVVPSSLKADFN